jgi:4-alpha-glucanotransferase
MVALEPLIERGWLPAPELSAALFDSKRVDYGRVIPWRTRQLRLAAAGFFARATDAQRSEFELWRQVQADWLADYSLFMALESAHGGKPFWEWDAPLRSREPAALEVARGQHADEIAFWDFVQWCFDTQCAALRTYAASRDVAIMGDLPIFIAHHSADCWARPDLYYLDEDFQPTVVAGVPPDSMVRGRHRTKRWGRWRCSMTAHGEASVLIGIIHHCAARGCFTSVSRQRCASSLAISIRVCHWSASCRI